MSSLPPAVKKFVGYAWATVFFAVLVWWILVRDTDIYQRNFNTEQWEKAQQKRAERAAIRKERTERMKELDQMECQVMLRAKAALMPIEIERNTIYGMSQGKAESFVTKDFESSVELCEKYGISPFTSGDGEQ